MADQSTGSDPTEGEAHDRAEAAGDAGFGGIAASLVQAATSMSGVGVAVENVAIVVGDTKRIVKWRLVADCVVFPFLILAVVLLLLGQASQRQQSADNRTILARVAMFQSAFNECATPDVPGAGSKPPEVHTCYDDGISRTTGALQQIEVTNIAIGFCADKHGLTMQAFIACVVATVPSIQLPAGTP